MLRAETSVPRSLALVINFFESDDASFRVGVKVHLLPILDAFAFPSAVVGFE